MAKPQGIDAQVGWQPINASRLRHFITILQQGSGVGVSGASATWTPFAETWSAIENLRGGDTWRNGQYTTQKYTQITIRFQEGIVSNMRITYNDASWSNPGAGRIRTFVVQDVSNVEERNIQLELLCVELDGK
jgi:head-tail adaptor